MTYVRWAFFVVFWAFVLSVLHYTLPQWDTVRVTDTYERRENPGWNSMFWAQADTGADQAAPRDVFFVQTIRPNGDPMVYRNEDTGWGWPPYFKVTSADKQAEAANLRSDEENPKWVAVLHYGWRLNYPTAYPNLISLRPVDGPDQRPIPWVSIVLLIVFAALYWGTRVRVLRFWENKVAPRVERLDQRIRG